MILKHYYLLVIWVCQVFSQKCRYDAMDSSDYVGCFVDTPDRLLPHGMITSTNIDNNRCILHCTDGGYMYPGTEFSSYCFCGNNPWNYTAFDVDQVFVADFDCNYLCSADSSQICGGTWCLSVYRTGVKNDNAQKVLDGQTKIRYNRMGIDIKLDEGKAAISSVFTSKFNCAALCSEDGICTGFVYSAINGMCQLYWLKYQDLCDFTFTEGGSSCVYIND